MIRVENNEIEIRGSAVNILADLASAMTHIYTTFNDEELFASFIQALTIPADDENAPKDIRNFAQAFRRIILAIQIQDAIGNMAKQKGEENDRDYEN